MTSPRVMPPWSDAAIRYLLDSTSCPACGVDTLADRRCRNCYAELTADLAQELWAASQAAVESLMARQEVLDRVARSGPAVREANADPIRVSTAPEIDSRQTADPGPAVVAAPRSSWAVQSVLAVAGAGLFAVSAIVFTFFNPDLTDLALRGVILGVVTVPFLGGGWMLARRGLQFSAEAVGVLGMVFVALDVYAVSELAPSGSSAWALAAIATLASGALMVLASTLASIRSWLWISLCWLAVVPAMLGYAGVTTLAATLGHLGVAFVGLALLKATRVLARRFDGRLRPELVTIGSIQVLASAIVLGQIWFIGLPTAPANWLTITAVLVAVTALATVTVQEIAAGLWSAIAGAAGMGAAVSLPFALDLWAGGAGVWYLAVAPAAAATALLVLNGLSPRARGLRRLAFLGGAMAVAGATILPSILLAGLVGAITVLTAPGGSTRGPGGMVGVDAVIAVVVGFCSMSALLLAFSASIERAITVCTDDAPTDLSTSDAAARRVASATSAVAVWLAALAGLTLACLPDIPPGSRSAIAIGFAVVFSIAVIAVRVIRDAPLRVRLPLVVGSYVAVVLAVVCSLADQRVAIWAGIAIVGTIGLIARTLPPRVRFLHVGAAYAYALFIVAALLDLLGVETTAVLCLTTSLGSITAIAATFIRRVAPSAWYTILVVTAVPFAIGIVQVVFERSGWTALSTALIFALAVTLLITRRPGLGIALRAVAAGLLVPSLAVVVVCLGAQVLLGSASPVTLPVIAALVAIALPSTGGIGSILTKRGIGAVDAMAARTAIEASALLTGAIAVLLALVRVAAGLPTTLLVLLILGLGAGATSFWTKRRYGWWVCAASFTGALWCALALEGIDALEPYLLPPSLIAATVGLVLTARGFRALPLYVMGLLVAVVPVLLVLATSSAATAALDAWRGYGLILASWLLFGLGALLGRGSPMHAHAVRALRIPTLGIAMGAGAAGAIQSARFGLGVDSAIDAGVSLVVLCFALGVAGALPAATAARVIRSIAPDGSRLSRTRWLGAPAAVYVAAATWGAIQRDWFTIWAMWVIMLAYLAMIIVIATRSLIRPTSLPPAWFVFGLALITSIVAWSPRGLRVEWFSVPLGLSLFIAGSLVLHAQRAASALDRPRTGTITSWPAGWLGSWPLLAPGIITTMLASVVATFTDPLTWRAILVIVIALVCILLGSSQKLAAPFLLGIVVLPIENVLVFVVQIGRGIESVPWWITLAVVGSVLLIIAVTYERRAGEANTLSDRLRDLR